MHLHTYKQLTHAVRNSTTAVIAALSLSAGFAGTAVATTIDLDVNFGGGGILNTAIGAGSDYANAIAIQRNGKIVVAGSSDKGSDEDFALARYDTNGTLDTGFDAHQKIDSDSKSLWPFYGTSRGGVAKVEIALRKVDRSQLKRGRCLWLKNTKANFLKTKAKRKRCVKQHFLTVKGTKKWSYKLRGRLPKGRYELYVRAIDKTGETQRTFTLAQGNLLVFSVVFYSKEPD